MPPNFARALELLRLVRGDEAPCTSFSRAVSPRTLPKISENKIRMIRIGSTSSSLAEVSAYSQPSVRRFWRLSQVELQDRKMVSF